ncbi:MAG: hypothetical protein QGG42_21795 [Phycisphaerae bacterium]|jgi:hypothetical protein|nr:hypothetical protein [Phycisphaerae bacterium]
MNRNAKWIAAALVVSATFCATFALAQPAAEPSAKTGEDDWMTRAKAAISRTLSRYIYQYKPGPEQKAKLEKVLIAQYKDLMDHDKVYAPKTKVVDDKIAVLQKEIAALNKQKAVYTDKRTELLLDHKAELNNVFTDEQRTASVIKYLKSLTTYRYWGGLTKAQQADLTAQFEAAALKVVQAKPEESDNVLSTVRRELQKSVQELLTPETRQRGETQYLADSTVRSFYRVKLTDAQKEQIRELCNQATKRKSELYAKYRQLDKDRDSIRKAMYKYSTSEYARKLRAEVSEKVLTDEQRKANSSRSSRYRSSKSSRRSSGTSSRKSSPTPPKASRTKTPN